MNTPFLYRFVLAVFVLALPSAGFAAAKNLVLLNGESNVNAISESLSLPFQEKPDDKRPDDKKPDERRPDDKRPDDKRPGDDKRPEHDRPDVIKEVPRSRRLPKPAAVTERVRVKRPPVHVPRGGGIKRNLGMH